MQPKPLRVRTGARVKRVTRVAVATVGLALVVIAAGGCASKQERDARREARRLRHVQMDPTVAKGLAPGHSPVAGLTPASPIVTATPRFAPVDASDSAAAPAGAVQYTVVKGDTLFGIARARYGSGGQWQRIASANPGLSPETLKAGTTIVVP